ncbi:MAG TPA: phosphopantetheine-binding protein [Thermoanaerobaculia bacterium]
METTEIRDRVKGIIAKIGGLDRTKIGDRDALVDDLRLDSLSLLEIGVDVDLEFGLNLPDESYRGVGTIPAMVELVESRLAELEAAAVKV